MEVKKGKDLITRAKRTHIIYFLNRMGRTEHPHLIRVHHFNRNGVYLRDVKRWLSNFRGEDMPNSFTWSYKRRYKTGFVWQDLVEDEPLTPTPDDENEYVLKGSEIISRASLSDVCVCGGKKAESEKSTTTTSTEESMKPNARKPEKDERKNKKRVLITYPATFSETQSHSTATSNVFRNSITCVEVDSNDSAITASNWVNRASKNPSINETETTAGGSPTVLGSAWNQQNSRKRLSTASNISNGRRASLSSQCGKTFKPEKLHSHMMSCKGMKSSTNGGGGGVVSSTMAPKERLPWR